MSVINRFRPGAVGYEWIRLPIRPESDVLRLQDSLPDEFLRSDVESGIVQRRHNLEIRKNLR
jgi:hypothetical protein